jgi:hypothetical protein
MPSLDLNEVPLFIGSIPIFIVQAHLLLPPPLSQWQSPPPFALPARLLDPPVHHVSEDHGPPDVNVVQYGIHAAFLEYVGGPQVHPPVMRSLLWLMFLSHSVGRANVKPLQLCQGSC